MSCMTIYAFSEIANHQVRHKATRDNILYYTPTPQKGGGGGGGDAITNEPFLYSFRDATSPKRNPAPCSYFKGTCMHRAFGFLTCRA